MKTDKERRRHKRFKYEALVSHDVSTNDIIHTGKLYNFSKGGLYFESDQYIYPGEDIFVGLAIHTDTPGKDTQLIFEVKIIWLKEPEDSSYRYGFGGKFLSSYDSFNSLPEAGHAKKLVNHAAPTEDVAGENDPRKHSRKPYNKFLYFTYNDHDFKHLVTNIGRGGAFILTQEKFILGGKLTLTVPGSRRRRELKVRGWIVRTSAVGIGVSFERRSGRERRNDLDRRTGLERRRRKRAKREV